MRLDASRVAGDRADVQRQFGVVRPEPAGQTQLKGCRRACPVLLGADLRRVLVIDPLDARRPFGQTRAALVIAKAVEPGDGRALADIVVASRRAKRQSEVVALVIGRNENLRPRKVLTDAVEGHARSVAERAADAAEAFDHHGSFGRLRRAPNRPYRSPCQNADRSDPSGLPRHG